jgi:hypothetical protein
VKTYAIKLALISRDTSIQCRATLNVETITEYCERMKAGDRFPPVVLFGTPGESWIGDGWHRVMAAENAGLKTIRAEVRRGHRSDALKFALGANAVNGLRRTNADKRRCVEIALEEFPNLSSRAVAKMCGVGHEMVDAQRPPLAETANAPATRTTSDGRQYPARRAPATKIDESPDRTPEKPLKLGPPSDGMDLARMAVMDLEQIRPDDTQRAEALQYVRRWINEHP